VATTAAINGSHAQAPLRSVAVLDFRNLSADSGDAWLGPALTEMLRTELASGEELRMVSGENVASVRFVALVAHRYFECSGNGASWSTNNFTEPG
jgi:TolB-like protein